MVKVLQSTSGIVMRLNQLLKLSIHTKFSAYKLVQVEEILHLELRLMKSLSIHSLDKIKYNSLLRASDILVQ